MFFSELKPALSDSYETKTYELQFYKDHVKVLGKFAVL